MGTPAQLQTLLETILGSGNVYFQPPESVKLQYPCIIFSRTSGETLYANDKPYSAKLRYMLKIIDKSADSTILTRIAELPMCKYDRHYTASNLHHDIFNIYF